MNNANVPPELLQKAPSTSGMAIAALVLGIVAFVLSFLIVGAVFGVVGLIFGALHLRRSRDFRPMAWIGLSLSILGIVAAALFGFTYYKGYQKFHALMKETTAGDLETWEGVIAPDFTVTTLDQQTVSLSELKGKRVVLDFWATWCPPCVKEIPHFIRLRSEVSTNDLVIVGISSEEASALEAFVKKKGINYPIVSKAELPKPYSEVTSIPTTFFIDRNGVIQSVLIGYHDYDQLKAAALSEDVPESSIKLQNPEVRSAPVAPAVESNK